MPLPTVLMSNDRSLGGTQTSNHGQEQKTPGVGFMDVHT